MLHASSVKPSTKKTRKGQNMTTKPLISLFLAVLLLPISAIAAPKISLNVRAEVEVTTEEDGKQVTKRVEASEVTPGQEVIYTLNYINASPDKALNVKLNNRVPANTTYKPDSAWGENTDIEFSIDAGKTFKQPSLLVYEVSNNKGEKEERKASPEKYTNIRWTVKEIAGDSKGEVGFRIKVN
jgi:uncharacterized repeat protein (TIGR01451 family)